MCMGEVWKSVWGKCGGCVWGKCEGCVWGKMCWNVAR